MSSSDAKIGGPAPTVATVAGARNPSNLTEPLLVDAQGNLLVTGNITASNPSVGPNGSTAPTSSTEIGFIDGSGNLQPVSSANPLPVDVSLTLPNPLPVSDATTHTELTTINTTLGSPIQQTGGTVTANQGTAGASAWPVNVASLPLPSGAATEATLAAFSAKTAGAFVPEAFDYTLLTYTGSNITTVVYKTGGAGGTTVATLTLAYDGSNNLSSVTKT